jgi:hypothetical protein
MPHKPVDPVKHYFATHPKAAEDLGHSLLKSSRLSVGKQVKTLWVVLAFLWIPVAFVFAGWLNGIQKYTNHNTTVPVCYQTPHGEAPLVSNNVQTCKASTVTAYGVPFTFKKVYTLEKPQYDFISDQSQTRVVRYVGLFGEELTTIDRDVRRYGKTYMGWNFISLLVAPFVVVGVVAWVRRDGKKSS